VGAAQTTSTGTNSKLPTRSSHIRRSPCLCVIAQERCPRCPKHPARPHTTTAPHLPPLSDRVFLFSVDRFGLLCALHFYAAWPVFPRDTPPNVDRLSPFHPSNSLQGHGRVAPRASTASCAQAALLVPSTGRVPVFPLRYRARLASGRAVFCLAA